MTLVRSDGCEGELEFTAYSDPACQNEDSDETSRLNKRYSSVNSQIRGCHKSSNLETDWEGYMKFTCSSTKMSVNFYDDADCNDPTNVIKQKSQTYNWGECRKHKGFYVKYQSAKHL